MGSKGVKPPKVSPPHSEFVEAPQHQPTHDFTLQTIMEVQKSIGRLEAKIEGADRSFDKVDEKLSSIDTKLNNIDKKVYAAGAVISLIVIVVGLATRFI